MANKTSHHILGASSNLLGFCLVVISALHIGQLTHNSYVDEFASLVALLLAISSVLSFLSIRTENSGNEKRLEAMADSLFLLALIGIFAIVFIVAIKLWNR
jgi:hypothetical protein